MTAWQEVSEGQEEGVPAGECQPACLAGQRGQSLEHVAELIGAGMDIMRLNMSHAEPADVVAAIRNVRRCVAEHNARAAHDAFKRVVGIALDTQGPAQPPA